MLANKGLPRMDSLVIEERPMHQVPFEALFIR